MVARGFPNRLNTWGKPLFFLFNCRILGYNVGEIHITYSSIQSFDESTVTKHANGKMVHQRLNR